MEPAYQTSFGELLRQFRRQEGLTQEELAERAGLSVRGLKYLEGDERHPQAGTIRRLADALHLTEAERSRLLNAAATGSGWSVLTGGPPTEKDASPIALPKPAPPTTPTNLPDPPTRFIGRAHEIAELVVMLHDPHIRLITLTGPGGTGKTRLALQVAASFLPTFGDGVYVVSLASLADPALVPSAIAEAVGVREVAGEPLLATLSTSLAAKRLLLVLDNFEHLLPAALTVAALLDAAHKLRVLVTSRMPLHLSREHEYPVPPLTLPDLVPLPALETLARNEAIAFFVERAGAVKPGFAVTSENAAAIGAICHRLDGLPLALELAAARIRLLPPASLLHELSNPLKVLTGGAVDRPSRQRTLRHTIDWSYHLLSEGEQALFARLAVFAGGCSLPSIEAVCDPAGELDVLEDTTSLIEKSLLRREGREEARFSMLETIREYAAERLAERGEAEDLRAAHAAHYLDLAAAAAPHLEGPDLVSWLDRLERDHDNLRAALSWAIHRGDGLGLGLRLATYLSFFWYYRGHFREGRAMGDAILSLPTPPRLAALRVALLRGTGRLALRQGDNLAARAYLDEGLALARRVGDANQLLQTIVTLGFVARVQEDYASAQAALEEALQLGRAQGDRIETATALHHLGLLALEADQNLETAWTLTEESLALYREIDDYRMVGIVLGTLGRIARARGDLTAARAMLAESMIVLRDIGDLGTVPQMLYTLAAVDADAGRMERAVRLQAAAAALEETFDTRAWPSHRRERDGWMQRVQTTLEEASFAAAWTEGQAMTVERVMADALEESI